jgi:hypothetical protein
MSLCLIPNHEGVKGRIKRLKINSSMKCSTKQIRKTYAKRNNSGTFGLENRKGLRKSVFSVPCAVCSSLQLSNHVSLRQHLNCYAREVPDTHEELHLKPSL